MPSDRFSTSNQPRPAHPQTVVSDARWRLDIADVMAKHTPVTPALAPRTSAVQAGWICVILGLATAWLFPLAHLFFSLGLTMAIIAMATHQVRSGLQLLAGALAGSAVCALVFLSGMLAFLGFVLTQGGQAVSPLQSEFQAEPPRLPAPVISRPLVAAIRPQNEAPASVDSGAAGCPLSLDEVKLMLRTGLSDTEIIAAVAGRPRVESLGPLEAAELRALGAGDRLLAGLRNSRLYAGATLAAPARTTAADTAPPVRSMPLPVSTPVDYAARDRRVASLQQQIDALDNQIRTIRNHPGDSYSRTGVQSYLDQLDQQRNALRREKWQLEGR